MHKKIIIYEATMLILAFILCIVTIQLYVVKKEKISLELDLEHLEVQQVESSMIQPVPKYLIVAQQGVVKVLHYADESEYMLLPQLDLRTMRNEDRKLLENGILVYSDQEVKEFLEDYGS